jgi:hypothetical protein
MPDVPTKTTKPSDEMTACERWHAKRDAMTPAELWVHDIEEEEAMYRGEDPTCRGDDDGPPPRCEATGAGLLDEGARDLISVVADFNVRGGLEHLPERSRMFVEELRSGLGVHLYELLERVSWLEHDMHQVATENIPGPVSYRRSAEHKTAVEAGRKVHVASQDWSRAADAGRERWEAMRAQADEGAKPNHVALRNLLPAMSKHLDEAAELMARACALLRATVKADENAWLEGMTQQLERQGAGVVIAARYGVSMLRRPKANE